MEQFTGRPQPESYQMDAKLSRPSAPPRRPSLLPAFEPVSSSPPLAKSLKRKHDDVVPDGRLYPTPVPTSSTGILPSSPPRHPSLRRTQSNVSERNPLADVPTVNVPVDGEPVLLGRSSNSCNFQLPYNRHISRVHVSVKYLQPDAANTFGQISVECLGWNGAIVRCGGREHSLEKGDTYLSSQPATEIILDIQDTRVIVAWPDIGSIRARAWDDDSSPERVSADNPRIAFGSSPPPLLPQSPVSPSPARHAAGPLSTSLTAANPLTTSNDTIVQVYEDPDSDHVHEETLSRSPSRPSLSRHASGIGKEKAMQSQESLLSSVPDDLSDQENEENDPIVHSFGPFGSNILSRLGSFTTSGELNSPHPQARRRSLIKAAPLSPHRGSEASKSGSALSIAKSMTTRNESPIKNHVINQLAFSRLHSMPLSTIHLNLPAELKAAACSAKGDKEMLEDAPLTDGELKQILDSIPCVGEIAREGKDAAGKALENEYYYLPEMDDNVMRRDTVKASMGSTSLRAVRKNHKVCKRLRVALLCCQMLILAAAIFLEAPSPLNLVPSKCYPRRPPSRDLALARYDPTAAVQQEISKVQSHHHNNPKCHLSMASGVDIASYSNFRFVTPSGQAELWRKFLTNLLFAYSFSTTSLCTHSTYGMHARCCMCRA